VTPYYSALMQQYVFSIAKSFHISWLALMQSPEGYAAYFGKMLYIYYIFMRKRHLILMSLSTEYSQCVTDGAGVDKLPFCNGTFSMNTV
jgi:hypothetical protein